MIRTRGQNTTINTKGNNYNISDFRKLCTVKGRSFFIFKSSKNVIEKKNNEREIKKKEGYFIFVVKKGRDRRVIKGKHLMKFCCKIEKEII